MSDIKHVTFLLPYKWNPNAPARANGNQWWGYPSRNTEPRVIVLHTAETDPSPASALNVARWQSTAAVPSSYHVIVDSDHIVRTVPDDHTAFHVAGFNSPSLGLSFATRADVWGRYPIWDALALANAAQVAARWSDTYRIPTTILTRSEALSGESGFVFHSTMDPARRSDPGSKFPLDNFMNRIDTVEVDEMAGYAEQIELMAQMAVAQEVGRIRAGFGLPAEPESDHRWGRRISGGRATIDEAIEALKDRAADRSF